MDNRRYSSKELKNIAGKVVEETLQNFMSSLNNRDVRDRTVLSTDISEASCGSSACWYCGSYVCTSSFTIK